MYTLHHASSSSVIRIISWLLFLGIVYCRFVYLHVISLIFLKKFKVSYLFWSYLISWYFVDIQFSLAFSKWFYWIPSFLSVIFVLLPFIHKVNCLFYCVIRFCFLCYFAFYSIASFFTLFWICYRFYFFLDLAIQKSSEFKGQYN